MTCQYPSDQSFSGKQCVSLGSTWTQSNVHTTVHLSVSAWWVVCGLEQRLDRSHTERAWTEEMHRPKSPDSDLPATHGLWTLANAHKLYEPWLPFLSTEIIVIPYLTRSLREVNGLKHMKVICKPGSSRRRQACYGVFMFQQVLICHIKFTSWVSALLFRQVAHLVLCQFVHLST